eukprot:CAMPEP_0196585694 /NCGR_PEP_ID=MMETSP1081-20130531/51637_1 /TAXON_ID=36882 /ORGANISM="Pyramimonas amylifera, Strain CCMP720" /LENGTH=251 /DNA_ID=CAMNT_0041907319 /DNA_START=635 /DNA_END=1387 /DNA_ORIENTATION=-
MGTAMMDFVVREARAVVEGGMAIIRLGTCGVLDDTLPVGSLIVASKGSVSVRRDPDAFHSEDTHDEAEFGSISASNLGYDSESIAKSVTPFISSPSPYWISRRVMPSEKLSQQLYSQLQEVCLAEGVSTPVVRGLNASACSFYSSQARMVDHFDDRNEDLMNLIHSEHPEVTSLEMETFHLLDLARCSRGTVEAAACAIGLAQRKSNDFLQASQIRVLERIAGEATLRSLTMHKIENDIEGGCSDASKRVW